VKRGVIQAWMPIGKGCPFCGDTLLGCAHYVEVEISGRGVTTILFEQSKVVANNGKANATGA
jgi:hypothetical protein